MNGSSRSTNAISHPTSPISTSARRSVRSGMNRTIADRPITRASPNPTHAAVIAPAHETMRPPQNPNTAPLAAVKSSAGNGTTVWITINKIDATGAQAPQATMTVRRWGISTCRIPAKVNRRPHGLRAMAVSTMAAAVQRIHDGMGRRKRGG
jgi:hypothetical protein